LIASAVAAAAATTTVGNFFLRRFGPAQFAPTIQFLATSNRMLTLLRMG
jgi:hypothetical protein